MLKLKNLEYDFITFSDTLVLTIIDKSNAEYFFDQIIEGFTQHIEGVFQSYFSRDYFLRGAISFGDIEKRGNHFVGPAVDDAADYFEAQEMIGICLTPKATIAMEYSIEWNQKYFSKKIDNFVIKYKTPFKKQNRSRIISNKLAYGIYNTCNWQATNESFK